MSEEAPPENGETRLRTLRRSTRGRVSLIWAIPLIAVVLGATLVVQTYLEKGPTIEIEFPEAAGIQAGATPIKFLDVEIGVVQEVRLKSTQDAVIAVAELDAGAETYLKEGTVFWLVQPRISLAGISGVETLLSGQYIEVVPSDEGAYTTSFQGALSPPIGARYPNAKNIELETDQLGSITQGTPVSHRGLRAGEVEHVELGEEGGPMRVYVVIDEAFASRVRETSHFWNSSGIQAKVGLDGVEVRTDGLAALLAAGIAFDSPDPAAPEAASGTTFPLHAGFDAARESQLRRDSVAVQLESRDGTGLSPGTPIYYRGLEVGSLGKSGLTADAQAVRIQAFVEPRFRPLVREDTRFYKSSGIDFSLGLDGVRLRTEGLRAVAFAGVSIAVPEGQGAPAADGTVFALYDEPEETWHAWKPNVQLEGPDESDPVEHRLPPDPNAAALELRLAADELGGLSEGSPVLFRRVAVGEVVGTALRGDGDSVEIRIRIERAHRRLVGDETRFWRSAGLALDIGLGGLELEVGSLRSLALGGISFGNPAGPGERARWGDRFTLHVDEEAAHADLRAAEVLVIAVEAQESTLTEGAPVYFRRHQVGEVGRTSLTADAQAVRIDLHIERAFAPLVRSNTRFWSPDAVSIHASLAGVEVEAVPVQALLAGGVMLATPTEAAGEAAEGTVFRLEESAPADWHHWNPDLPLGAGAPATFAAEDDEPEGMRVLLVATDVEAIGEGDPIFFRGLQIGTAGTPRLADDGTEVLVDALIAPEYAVVIRSNTHFWNASGIDLDVGLGGVAVETGPLETLIRGGIQVATPEPAGEPARSGDRFVLRAEPEQGWKDWAPVLH